MVFLSRKTGARDLALGAFLVDAYCLGVRTRCIVNWMKSEMEELLDGAGATAPLIPVDPSYARKLLRDAAAYALSLGLPPHADYASAELLFGDVAADSLRRRVPVWSRRPAALRSRADRVLDPDPAAN